MQPLEETGSIKTARCSSAAATADLVAGRGRLVRSFCVAHVFSVIGDVDDDHCSSSHSFALWVDVIFA